MGLVGKKKGPKSKNQQENEGLLSVICWEKLKKDTKVSFTTTVVWKEPVTAKKLRKKIRRQQRGTTLRKAALSFVWSQRCSFGNLCSQAGSYTVQIHHLLSEVRALLQKRGNRNKAQEM